MTNDKLLHTLELNKLQQELDNISKIMHLLRFCIIHKKLSKSLTFCLYHKKLKNLIKQKNNFLKVLKKGNE